MKNLFRILACLAAIPGVMTECFTYANAGEIYREGIFLAYLERNDEQSLPPVLSGGSQLFFSESSHETTLTSSETILLASSPAPMPAPAQSASAGSLTHVGAEVVAVGQAAPVHSEAPIESVLRSESETVPCHSDPCEENAGWMCRKSHQLHRRIYFSQQSNHKKSLYPVIHPHCQPAYGVYETCWRQIQPNPCYYRSEESLSDPSLLPVPQPSAGSAGSPEPLKSPPSDPARPYEK
ncbi:MAG TPA: hypothetical protein VMM56_11450 [Planctomycetaceae bacterium]|nr:hypothetical protein [Planctomycetaceae bacterium]